MRSSESFIESKAGKIIMGVENGRTKQKGYEVFRSTGVVFSRTALFGIRSEQNCTEMSILTSRRENEEESGKQLNYNHFRLTSITQFDMFS